MMLAWAFHLLHYKNILFFNILQALIHTTVKLHLNCVTFCVSFREFFSREAGRNTVEFFKDDGNGQLYIALKFESKDVAKEVLNR